MSLPNRNERERFRGHCTKISDRFFFSCSDKLPVFLLAEIWEYQVQETLVFGLVFRTFGCRC